jgi:hypothetical protein
MSASNLDGFRKAFHFLTLRKIISTLFFIIV